MPRRAAERATSQTSWRTCARIRCAGTEAQQLAANSQLYEKRRSNDMLTFRSFVIPRLVLGPGYDPGR